MKELIRQISCNFNSLYITNEVGTPLVSFDAPKGYYIDYIYLNS